MNAPKCRAEDYIDFLAASPRAASGTEAARTQPLWAEAEPLVAGRGGVLVLDDSVLDKPYAKQMGLVARQWSGKHGYRPRR
jgi:hypothetical protein